MRLFVALEPPEPVVDALAAWSGSLERDGLRVLARESLHVTLAFLGELPDDTAPRIADALHAAARPVGSLRLADPAWLPPRRPRVLAVDLVDEDGACTRLQAGVARALADLRLFTPERRPFRPHVTVARVRKGARVAQEVPPEPEVGTFAAAALTLYRSRLSPHGARYDALTRLDLT